MPFTLSELARIAFWYVAEPVYRRRLVFVHLAFALAGVALLVLLPIAAAFSQDAGIPINTPQGTVTIPDATVQWLCGNDGAWIKWIISQLGPWASYLFGYLGLHFSASAIANVGDKLPAPVRMIVNVLALNLRDAKPPVSSPSPSQPPTKGS